MYTGMERNICLSRLRQFTFPDDWEELVGLAFPTLRELLLSMLHSKPSLRPSAESVAQHIQSILSEFTIFSLDESRHKGPDVIMLRVEAEPGPDTLGQTLLAIEEAAKAKSQPMSVVQYGLRSSTIGSRPTSIMEFALQYPGEGSELAAQLQKCPKIFKARQVSVGNSSHNGNGKDS